MKRLSYHQLVELCRICLESSAEQNRLLLKLYADCRSGDPIDLDGYERQINEAAYAVAGRIEAIGAADHG